MGADPTLARIEALHRSAGPILHAVRHARTTRDAARLAAAGARHDTVPHPNAPATPSLTVAEAEVRLMAADHAFEAAERAAQAHGDELARLLIAARNGAPRPLAGGAFMAGAVAA